MRTRIVWTQDEWDVLVDYCGPKLHHDPKRRLGKDILDLVREAQKLLPSSRRRKILTASNIPSGLYTRLETWVPANAKPEKVESVTHHCKLSGTDQCPAIPRKEEMFQESIIEILVEAGRRLMRDPVVRDLFRGDLPAVEMRTEIRHAPSPSRLRP